MIDIRAEKIFPLSQIAKRDELPRRRLGKPLNVATLYRWAKTGVRGVRLETLRVGGTLCTSIEALQRFFVALASAPLPETAPRVCTMGAEHIERELDRAGL